MRVCLVSSSFYPATFYGGPISATWDLSKKLAENDVEMYVSTTNANGLSRLEVENNRYLRKQDNFFVKYYHEELINNFSLSFLFGIFNDIKKSDVVYIQYLFHYTSIISLIISVFQTKKIIVCPRGSLGEWGLQFKRKKFKKLWLFIFVKPFIKDVIFQASSYIEKKDIIRKYPNANVEIINDGVDFNAFQNAEKKSRIEILKKHTEIDFDEISNIFFSMGRLHKIKQFDVLINAFEIYLEKDKNAKLIIAGSDDGMGNQLEQQILELKLNNSVFLIGQVDFKHKKILFSNSDYFVLASEFESFGIVIAEALACGRPCVVSNKTPWKHLEMNNCGILVDNEKESIANGFSDIINKDFDSNKIKNYLKSNYDWGIIVSIFLKIIKNK